MPEPVYTLGMWRVRSGNEDAFVAAWKQLGAVFARLPVPPGKGTLVQSLSEADLFYSFGPWPHAEAVQAMRQDPEAQAAIDRLRALCTEAVPGGFRLVAEA